MNATAEQASLVDPALERNFLAAVFDLAASGDSDGTLLLRTIPAAAYATPNLRATWNVLQAVYQAGDNISDS